MELEHPKGLQPITPEIIGLFAPQLGQFVMATAQLDLQLNFLIYETHPLVAALKLAKTPPFALGDKINLMIKLFDRHPDLAPIAPSILTSLHASKVLNDLRRYVVHGALHGFVSGPDPELFFMKADYSKATKAYEPDSRLVSLAELSNGTVEMTAHTRLLSDAVRTLNRSRVYVAK